MSQQVGEFVKQGKLQNGIDLKDHGVHARHERSEGVAEHAEVLLQVDISDLRGRKGSGIAIYYYLGFQSAFPYKSPSLLLFGEM